MVFDPRESLPQCCVCGRTVDEVKAFSPWGSGGLELRIVVRCHGAEERYDIQLSEYLIYTGLPVLNQLAFLRPVAKHGAVSNDARRERRQRFARG